MLKSLPFSRRAIPEYKKLGLPIGRFLRWRELSSIPLIQTQLSPILNHERSDQRNEFPSHLIQQIPSIRFSQTFTSVYGRYGASGTLLQLAPFDPIGSFAMFSTSSADSSNLRDRAGQRVRDLKEKAEKRARDVKEKAGEYRERALEKSEEYREIAREKSEEYREIAREKSEEYREMARERAEEVREKAHEIRDRAQKQAEKGATVARTGAKKAGSMLQQYGPVFIVTYFGVYVVTLGSLFASMQSGLVDPVTIVGMVAGQDELRSTPEVVAEMLSHYSFTKPVAPMVMEKPWVANFALAWVTTKLTEPVRFAVTGLVVPRLARKLGYVKATENEDDEKSRDEDTVTETQHENIQSDKETHKKV